jgi:hypothetical protein
MMLRALFTSVMLGTALAMLLGCPRVTVSEEVEPPPRPSGVPRSTFWVGGLDGGVFVIVEKRDADPGHIYRGTIYSESGTVRYAGRLAMVPQSGQGFDYRAAQSFTGWDGDTMSLIDGRHLKAIDQEP